jgi:hypothetical protein
VYFGLSLSAIVKDLNAGSKYYFKVKATNRVGDSLFSDIYSFLIVEKPSPPINARIDSYSNTFVTIEWEEPLYNGGQSISNFYLYREDCSMSVVTPVLV